MAVTIKKKALTITSLLTRLYEADKLAGHDFLKKAQELEHTGHTLLISPTTFSIAAAGNANVLSVVPLKSETVTLAIKGKVGHTVKVVIKDKITDLITTAYQKFMDAEHPAILSEVYDKTMAKYHGNNGGMKVAAIKEYRNLTGSSLKEAKDMVENWIEAEELAAGPMPVMAENGVADGIGVEGKEKFSFGEIKFETQSVYGTETNLQAAPVALKTATKLNQPVTGTSGGSIYHVIAIGESCVVAARIKTNNEIAIRAEVLVHANSTEGQKARSGLKFAGLEQKPAGHFSLHLDPEDFAMVKRSIGSTIMAMSIPFWGVNTDLHTIQGVGK